MASTLPGGDACPSGLEADRQFGPQVNVACREFDFTLLFEDGFFMLLPAVLFLLVVPWRFWSLWKSPVKLTSRRLAIGKLTLLSTLFTLHVLNTIYTTKSLRTTLSLPATLLTTISLLSSALLSLLEDQRTIHPSDLLVIYFSASTILFIPRLRTLYLLHSSFSLSTSPINPIPHLLVLQVLWTLIFALTILVAVTESLGKSTLLQPRYKHVVVTKEQTAGFWSRGFFVWLLPFLQVGYKKTLGMGDIPGVDGELRVESAGGGMEGVFRRLLLAQQRQAKSGNGGKQEKVEEKGEEVGKKKKGWMLIYAAYEANKWPFWSAVVPRLALLGFSFCQPFLIEAVVGYLASRERKEGEPEDEENETPQPPYFGRALVGGFVLLYVGIAVSRAIYWRQTNRMIARIRSGLIAMVYQHTTTLRAVDVKDSAAVTLMGTDVERIVTSIKNVHELWASVPGVGIAIWLLARQISYAAIVPLVICIVCVVGASFVGAGTGPAQAAWNERVQKRVAVTANMLGDMKAVKMLGLTGVLGNIIEGLRRAELKTSERFRKYLLWTIQISNAPGSGVAPYATFVVYGIMSAVKKDQSLLAAQAFASLSLINLLTTPLLIFCQAFPAAMQAVACFGRIEAYLTKQEVKESDQSSVEDRGRSAGASFESGTELRSVVGSRPLARETTPGALASFAAADISWSADTIEPVLQGVNLTIKPGFTAVIGPVGSGKSTLLESLVGETTLQRGSVTTNFSRAAYCPQAAWLMNDTIRHNITGSSEDFEIDQKWYDSCILSCGLHRDLEGMVAGDQTVVGTNGSSLSGGQRQRVALARAVYSRAPVIILDDVMSGLDPATAKEITTRLFSRQGYLRKACVSVVLATHNKRLLPYMDEIIVLEGGRIADIGLYSEIQSRGDLKLMVMTDDDVIESGEEQQQSTTDEIPKDSKSPAMTQKPSDTTTRQPTKPNLERRQGSWSVYAYYARSAGALSLSLWAFFTVLGAITTNYMTIWISNWSSASTPSASNPDPHPNLGYYLGIYTLLVVLAQSGTVGECFVFLINIISNTALSLHTDLLKSVLSAPLSFFSQSSSPASSSSSTTTSPPTDSNSDNHNKNNNAISEDSGTITNRFSQDMDLIDMTLPIQAIMFTSAGSYALVQLIIICILGKYLAATVPLLAVTMFLVQKYYLRSSRQLRLLDIEAKAPVYKHFLETVTAGGVATIRAFGWDRRFRDRLAGMMDEAQKPFYMLACIQQWLALVLDLVVGGMAVVLVGVAVGVAPDPEKAGSSKSAVSAGALGVSLVLVMTFNELIVQALQAWTRLETSIGAVARVRDFVRTTPKEEDPAADCDNGGCVGDGLTGWPSRGEIKIEKICASYGPHNTSSNTNTTTSGPPALKNLTLTIPSGSKLAVIGPSGSGKTTFLLSLLRMIPLSSGSITIDSLNISTVPRSRHIFNVIPQDPFFIPNTTLAFNLDPFGHLSHLPPAEATAKMESALRLVTLWPGRATVNGQTLDSELFTSEWSVGELQLLALARALLLKDQTRILVLDEAMSSVDEKTEAVMQEVIDIEFKEHTVIAVVHRLTYIERFDLVAVLKSGEMVEFGEPEGLIERAHGEREGNGSVFGELYRGFQQGHDASGRG